MSNDKINRRDVLKKATASAVAATAVGSGSVSAETPDAERQTDLEDQYTGNAKSVLASRGTELLKELADRDIVARPSPQVFDLDNRLKKQKMGIDTTGDGWTITQYTNEQGTKTADLVFSKTTDEHVIKLHVQPEAEKEYALVESKATGERFAVDASTENVVQPITSSSDDVSTNASDCEDYRFCADDICRMADPHNQPVQCWSTRVKMICSASYDRCHCFEDGTSCSQYYCGTSCN